METTTAPELIAAALAAALAGSSFAQGQQGQRQATEQERLRQPLTQAGFRDVHILGTA